MVFTCPCCGEDLYARRPMSYAEMEGLGGIRPIAARANPGVVAGAAPPERTARLIDRLKRWIRVATRF